MVICPLAQADLAALSTSHSPGEGGRQPRTPAPFGGGGCSGNYPCRREGRMGRGGLWRRQRRRQGEGRATFICAMRASPQTQLPRVVRVLMRRLDMSAFPSVQGQSC